MGVLAALATALGWAVSGTLIASKSGRVDFLSLAGVRMFFAGLFVTAALFALGGQDGLLRMDLNDFVQLIGNGFLSILIGEPLYVLAIALLGLTRAFTSFIGLYSLAALILPALILGEPVSEETAVGAVMIVVGVYTVAVYGRAGGATPVRADLHADPAARDAGAAALLPGSAPAWQAGGLHSAPALFLGSTRARGGGAVSPALFLGTDRSNAGRTAAQRPRIAGGSVADAASGPASATVRLPIIGLPASRLLVGTLLALVAALCLAGSATWLKSAARDFEASTVAVLILCPAALILATGAIVRPGSALRRGAVSMGSVSVIGLSGVISIGIGSIFMVFALQEIGPGPASVIFATSAVFALPLGAIVLRERVTVWGALGAALAVGGIALLA